MRIPCYHKPMNQAKDGRGVVAIAALLMLAGCGTAPELPYPNFVQATGPTNSESGSSFSSFERAASAAELKAKKYLTRTNFTPGKKEAVIALCQQPLQLIDNLAGKEFQFEYVPSAPFESKKFRPGWRLLGQTMVWRIEEAKRKEDFDAMVRFTLSASRFGADLTGGDCSDATLGFGIIDEARNAILSSVSRLSAKQLSTLSAGLEAVLKRMPAPHQTLENERTSMLLAIQTLQDDYRKGDWKKYETELRNEILPAVKFLKALKPNSNDRIEYFDSLAGEADAITASAIALSKLNARQRSAKEAPQFDKDRPWRRWSKHFFQAPKYLFAVRDRTIARMRLLAIETQLIALRARGKSIPETLSGFPTIVRIDPFTGKDFAYSPTATSYKLYSLGSDFRDDGGETNESATAPDLLIENSL